MLSANCKVQKWKVEVNEWAARQSRVARTSAIIQLAHPAISWLVLVLVLVLVLHYLYNLHYLHNCTISLSSLTALLFAERCSTFFNPASRSSIMYGVKWVKCKT